MVSGSSDDGALAPICLFVDEVYDGGDLTRVLVGDPQRPGDDQERYRTRAELAEPLARPVEAEDLVEGTRLELRVGPGAERVAHFDEILDDGGDDELLGPAVRVDTEPMRNEIGALLEKAPWLGPEDRS